MPCSSDLPSVVPGVLRYRGDQILVSGRIPESFGRSATVVLTGADAKNKDRRVRADRDGRFVVAINPRLLPPTETFGMAFESTRTSGASAHVQVQTVRESPHNPASSVPVNRADEPGICTCASCPPDRTLNGSSLDAFTRSETPLAGGVEVATGRVRTRFEVTAFETRVLGFDFALHHSSLVDYDGPWGKGVLHSFGLMIIQRDQTTGQVVTPDLRIFDLRSEDGVEWRLPRGFHSRLRLDTGRCRWTLTHFTGLEVECFQALPGKPGFPVSIREPNGNRTSLVYDNSGLLTGIETDIGQVQRLLYDSRSQMNTFIDHIGRTWRFRYDDHNRLTRIISPLSEFADIAPRGEVTRGNLKDVLFHRSRTTTLEYADRLLADHITAVRDPRGAVRVARYYDEDGRVFRTVINGSAIRYAYDAVSRLGLLDSGNRVTRVVDREGNITDYETHGAAGGPVNGRGRFGLRRRVTWTARGQGDRPLRDHEPEYWEQRWLHDCHCLAPHTIVEPFGSTDVQALTFGDFGIPVNWPRTTYTYNRFRQKTREEYTDGSSSIVSEWRHQSEAFGDGGQYSRPVLWTDPRAFDPSPIDTGLEFGHTWDYDARGNPVVRVAPRVRRGVESVQSIVERWTYNPFGQVIVQVDPNGNVTQHDYNDAESTGGDVNTAGRFGGYLARTVVGTDGSTDPVTALTTVYQTNALGMVTRTTDPRGHTHDTRYNDLLEPVERIQPALTLDDGVEVRYRTLSIHDGAGNKVMERRVRIDVDGTVEATPWIDRSMTYDDVNNLLSERVQVDANEANDLIDRYAYDRNDDPVVTTRPEGNREFRIYDERRLPFKIFTGVGPATEILGGFPSDKRARTLGGTVFVGLVIDTFDARSNRVLRRDARGNLTRWFFDFYDRRIGSADANSNGWARTYDNASNAVTIEHGAVDVRNGHVPRPLQRTYQRFDEAGRLYQTVQDIDLDSDEGDHVDPDDGKNSSVLTRLDPGSRPVAQVDANGNRTQFRYDAAGRRAGSTDALGNTVTFAFDPNSNLVALEETELPGVSASPVGDTFLTTWTYDALDRPVQQHVRGRRDDPIDDETRFGYDSRNNLRTIRDAEGRFTLMGWDDANRMIRRQRYAADPFVPSSPELVRLEWRYDRNGNVAEERAARELADSASIEITRYAYDTLDRIVRKVMPDSDDPIDGAGNGPDGIYDRVEIQYDANSSPVLVIDQRRVALTKTFDPGNRPTHERISRPPAVGGVTRRAYAYDAIDRVTTATNDFASDTRVYDALSRLIRDTQSIRLDGTGFQRGWDHPITLTHQYDRQSNRIGLEVTDRNHRDLVVERRFDALNRTARLRASYFDRPMREIAAWDYLGPTRVSTMRLGNGTRLQCGFDTKRRVVSHVWNGVTGVLAGFEYGYDRVDKALYERFVHDGGRYDHFLYNPRDEVCGVVYRSDEPSPPFDPPTRFFYDDLFNRTQADFGDPLGWRPMTLDCYSTNLANETTQMRRNGRRDSPEHDAAGNPTALVVRAHVGAGAESDVVAAARWDGLDMLVDIETRVAPRQNYVYDAFRRRIASIESDGGEVRPGSRRYVHDGWEVVEERLLDSANLSSSASLLERITIHGSALDEPLLVAIDRDGDGRVGIGGGTNDPDPETDREYYLLDNRAGSIMALLDASAERLLESYRYDVFGGATVFSADRNAPGSAPHLPSGPNGGFGNARLFAARVLDEKTGLYYYRHRYYDPISGRFLGRDPAGPSSGPNAYAYVFNTPVNLTDPLGLRVFCAGVQLGLVPTLGVGASIAHCYDDCGNEAYIASGGFRGMLDVGVGVELGVYAGSLAAFLNHPYLTQTTVGLGPVSAGIDDDPHGRPVGGRLGVELSLFPVGLSSGDTYSWVISKDLSRGYPCAPSRPEWPSVPYAEGDPTSDIPPVVRRTSSELPAACCCVGWLCTDETDGRRVVTTAILGVPAATHPRDCDSLCQAQGFAIGYGAQNAGRTQQCLPSATARALELYRRGLIHYLP